MKEDFILPDIGEGIVECELVEWLVKVGDTVAEDQPVADVQTDKALVQIPTKHSGQITSLYVQQGEIAKVHEPLFQVELSSEPIVLGTQPMLEPEDLYETESTSENTVSTNSKSNTTKALATPAVRRLARENDIDISAVSGSGRDGRVLKADMLKVIEGGAPIPEIAAPDEQKIPEPTATVDVIPIKGIRAVMAKQMAQAVQTIPHFTFAEEIDLTNCNALRKELNNTLPDENRITLMSFFIKALSLALKKFPIVNSHMSEAADEIHQYPNHNIGMAVDSPSGLLVPNIKSVDQRSLESIAREVKRLTEAGRAGRLTPADLKGGTITISNIGAIGGTVTTPIIHAPEVAIVGIGRIQLLPRPIQNQIEIREIIQVSWSGDHRVLDGGTIARFNNEWRRLLENPQQMLLTLV